MSTVDAAALLIGLREGLEALLIVGILVGLLRRLGHADKARYVWLGAGLGVVASVLLGILVQVLFATFFEDGPGAAYFEIGVALVAVGILTYMVLWMERHTRTLVDTVQRETRRAAVEGRWVLIGSLAFFTVVREGLEVVLFYAARLNELGWGPLLLSGAIGLALSALVVLAFFSLTVKVSLRAFFAITGMMLVVIAAGLLVHVVMAATDIGLLPAGEPVWDTSAALPDQGHWLGGPLHAFIGYTAAPTALQLLLYFGYLVGVGGWYLSRLVQPSAQRRTTVAAGALLFLLVSSFAVAGAFPTGSATASSGHHGSGATAGTPHEQLLAGAIEAVEGYDGKVGILVRHHGEPVHYNASTYQSFKDFIDGIWPYTGLPPELLKVDQGTILLDAADPYADQPDLMDAELVDAWLAPYTGIALPFTDPAGLSAADEDLAGGQFYVSPGTGPGVGEGDVYEMLGLATYRDWLKMENQSPMYGYVKEAWGILDYHIHKHFGDKVVVAYAHHVDPKMDPSETTEAAAQSLVDAGATLVIDSYMSSVHSDAMDTCMMAPHTRHALDAAGFRGAVAKSGMAGTHEAWARATADEVARLLDAYPEDQTVAVYLTQHGGNPSSPNPCGPEGSMDQYAGNTKLEYAAAEQAIRARLGDRPFVLRNVYGQGGGEADDGALSPMEALAMDQQDGVRHAVFLPYEFWGNALDNLVYLRESLGFQAEQAPYYGPGYSTRMTVDGIDVLVASAHFGTEAKAEALLARIGEAIEAGIAGDVNGHGGGHVSSH
ncbi:MAG TPA: FTR1 family protein [Candidatus Thermoplasmatota archaeon]|nr:FTR1 family protein [Candidatus Thermoplasmatota archaeon]